MRFKLDDFSPQYREQILAKLARNDAVASQDASEAPNAREHLGETEKRTTTHHNAKAKKERGVPNDTEMRFNREVLGGQGVYEGITFRLPGGARYTPDWVLWDEQGRMEAWEVKGSYRFGSEGRALTAWREAKAAFPSVRFGWAKWDGKKWTYPHGNEKI